MLIDLRKYLIDKVFDYGDSTELRNVTLQWAIVYLEILLRKSKLDVLDTDKDLWAASALLLASKYIELDDNIPFIQDLRNLGLKAYSTEIFIKSEKVLLKALNWELMIITPLHFAECILNHWAIFGDDRIKLKDINDNEIYRYASNIEFEYEAYKKDQLNAIISSIKKYSEFFWDVTIQSFDVQVYSYAVQGLYAVLAAREVMGIKPVWNKQYDQFTGLNKHHYKAQIDEIKVKINENKILSTLVNVVNQSWYKTSVPSTPSPVTEDATSSEVSSGKTDKSKSLKNSCLEKHRTSRESFDTRNYTHFGNFSSCSGATKENQKAEVEKMTMITNAAVNKHQQRKSFMRTSSRPAHKVETKSTRASSRIVINLSMLGNIEKKENEFSNHYGQTKNNSFMSTVDSIFAKKNSVATKDPKAMGDIKVSRYSLYDKTNLISQRSNTKNNDTCTSRSIKKTDVYTSKHLKRAKSKASNIKEFSKTFYSRGVSSRYQKSRNESKISTRNNGSESRPRCDNKVNKNGFMSVHNRICKIKPVRHESNSRQHKNFIKSNIEKISTYWETSKIHKVVNKERSSSKLGSMLKSSILGKSKVYKINDRAVDQNDANNITTAELVSVSSNFGKKNSMVSRALSNNVSFSKNAAVSNISQYKRHVHGKKSVDLCKKRPRDKENVNWLSIHATNKTQKFGRRNLSTIINNEHHQ
jgi:hypothetical protein